MATGGGGINIGGIYADLAIDSGKLDQGLAKGRQALDAIAAEVRKLQADFDRGAIKAGEFGARMAALSQTANELTARMQAAYTATNSLHTGMEVFNASAGRATAGGKNMGMMLMQLGYIADDVQYGFMGIVNNVAPLVMSMTGSGGIAAAAQVVTVGLYQLTQHWDQFMDAIGVGVIRTEAEEMEKLAKATSRTAEETARLNEYKKEQAELGKILGGQTKEQRETQTAVEKAFAESDPGKVRGALMAQFQRQLLPNEEDMVRQAGEAAARDATRPAMVGGGGNVPVMIPPEEDTPEKAAQRERRRQDAMEAERERIKKKIQAEAGERANNLIIDLAKPGPEGDAAVAELEKIVDRAPKEPAFQKGFLGDILRGRPGAVKEQAALEAQAKGNAEMKAERLKEDMAEADATIDKADELARAQHDMRLKNIRNRQENLQKGREAAPGVDELAERRVTMAMAGGIPMDAVVAEIRGVLMAQGRTEKQAGAAAEDIVKAAGKDVQKQALHDALNPPQAERRKLSEVFDASDLAGKIQSSVGGEDIQKQQLAELKQAKLALARMAEEKFTVRLKK
jgi:hypothetical protein